jgi:hypothetical protein
LSSSSLFRARVEDAENVLVIGVILEVVEVVGKIRSRTQGFLFSKKILA